MDQHNAGPRPADRQAVQPRLAAQSVRDDVETI